MANSKAKKKRRKIKREKGIRVEDKRGSWDGVNPIERKLPTLIERKRRKERKHRKVDEDETS